jgi:hypothetical protein
MVNVFEGPGQFTDPLAKVGVTVIVEVMGAVPPLVALNEMLPEPLANSPMAGFEFVQV